MPLIEKDAIASTAALTYARLLRENHDLIAQGKGDSAEAEALADRMDAPWYAMTVDEQLRMRGLSADLYALREGGPKRIEMSSEQLAAWQKRAKEAKRQSDSCDVAAALAFFREPIPLTLPRHIIPFLQARCWEKLGDPETADIFLREAERTVAEQLEAVQASA
jgi:hypothetical protein